MAECSQGAEERAESRHEEEGPDQTSWERLDVNEGHLQFLSSPEWAQMLQTDLLPWVLGAGDLGDEVLEVGPGPGLTTDLLRQRVKRITAIEIDIELARQLTDRLAGTNVR